jgi:hypothetical protein
MIQEKINLKQFVEETIFSEIDYVNFLFENKIAILLCLFFKKAKQWPFRNETFINEGLKEIPLLLAYLYSDDNKEINLLLDIHPMKCFSQLYINYNSNFSSNLIPSMIKSKPNNMGVVKDIG